MESTPPTEHFVGDYPLHSVASNSTDDRSSRRGSAFRGPFRHGPKVTGFPVFNLRPIEGGAAVYSRSMLSLGHGYPLWQPVGGTDRPEKYLQKGVGMGDVGFLGTDGDFKYLFNIFYPPTDPIQRKRLPNDFRTIEPSFDQWGVTKDEEFFSPGTVMVSGGVQVLRVSESPLKLELKTSALEGGMIVLPDGGSREDLVVTDKLYQYVKQHAIDWYQFTDFYDTSSSINTMPNGSLYLVTGSDTAKSWALAAFPSTPRAIPGSITMKYDAEEIDSTWLDHDFVRSKCRLSEPGGSLNSGAIFVRGLRVALSETNWSRKMARVHPATVPYYSILPTPILGYQARTYRLRSKIFGLPQPNSIRRSMLQYHPAYIILQILLEEFPTAVMAIVEDDLWCSLIHHRNSTYPGLVELLIRLFRANEKIMSDGVVRLSPKANTDINEAIQPKAGRLLTFFPTFIQESMELRRQRRTIVKAVKFLK